LGLQIREEGGDISPHVYMPERRQIAEKSLKKSLVSPIDPNVYSGLAAFRLALRRFLAFSEMATEAAGVTAQQYQALLVIRTHSTGAIMIREFAEQMLLQHNGAVQMVDRLVAGKLVRRIHSPTDGRSVLVSLTAKGVGVLERLASLHVKELLKHEPLLAESLKRLRQIGRAL
jgi:DNA-binding MarR family transcriptional regulator